MVTEGREQEGSCPEDSTPELGLRRKEPDVYERSIGEYVAIYLPGNSRIFLGKMANLIQGVAILNPFWGADYSNGNDGKRVLMNKDFPVGLIPGTAIEPTTRESLDGYCERCNREIDEENMLAKSKKSDCPK